MQRLPPAYARALRLRDAGAEDHVIAAELAIAPSAVTSLLAIGERKLAAVLAEDAGR